MLGPGSRRIVCAANIFTKWLYPFFLPPCRVANTHTHTHTLKKRSGKATKTESKSGRKNTICMFVCMCVCSKSFCSISQRNEAKIKFPANDKNFRSQLRQQQQQQQQLHQQMAIVVAVVVAAGRDESAKKKKTQWTPQKTRPKRARLMINFACGDNNNNNSNKSESAQFMAWQELPGRGHGRKEGWGSEGMLPFLAHKSVLRDLKRA